VNNTTKIKKNRLPATFMVLILAAPMVSAWIMYQYFPDVVRNLGTSNNGEFIIPTVKIDLAGLEDVDKKPLDKDYFIKKWTYIYIDDADCGQACSDHFRLMTNVRLTQGKEIKRLGRLFVLASNSVPESLRKSISEHPGMQTVLLSDAQQRAQFLKLFSFKDNENPLVAGNVYVVDPAGKLMMYYQDDKEILKMGQRMQKDMSKLMRNSQLRK